MKKSMETKQWWQELRRSVALALLVSGSAAAVLPGTAGATDLLGDGVSGKESIVQSAEKKVTSEAVSGGELTSSSDAAHVRGGYSYAWSTYTTDGTGLVTSGDVNGNTLRLSSNTNSKTEVDGGRSRARATGTATAVTAGNALGNTVTLQGGTYDYVFGGHSIVETYLDTIKNTAVSGDVCNNMVLISDTTVGSESYGGMSACFVSADAKSGSVNKNIRSVV